MEKIRKSSEVNHLVYVCTSQFPPIQNLLDWASRNDKLGLQELDPFVVKRVIPVDLQPHMLRVEFVILCERLHSNEIPKPKQSLKSKKTTKKNNQASKRWSSPTYNCNGHYRMFSTEEMARKYSRGTRKMHQDVDYQKRDSLYPPPLRGALYSCYENEYFNDTFVEDENRYLYFNRAAPKNSVPQYCERRYSQNVARFTNFQRDLGKALDSYYPPQLMSSKLAYANALLEEGMRIASEVLDNQHSPVSRYYSSRQTSSLPHRRNLSSKKFTY